MTKTKIEITCDLCDRPAMMFDSVSDAEFAGWRVFDVESHYADRDPQRKTLCPSCSKAVRAN